MKRALAIMAPLLLLALPVLHCGDEDTNPAEPAAHISYLSAFHTGCIGDTDKVGAEGDRPYLVEYSYQGDLLTLKIHYVANCCPSFVDETTILDRTIQIAVTDTLNGCRCICPQEDAFTFRCPEPGDIQVSFQTEDEGCAFDTLITLIR